MRSPIDEIRTACFVGAGTMGCVNSLVSAVSGYEAVLYDLDPGMLEQAPVRQREFADFMVAIGYCREDEIIAALDRIRMTTDPTDAAARADLVSESVVERLDVKREVHRRFDELCPPHTIITTNTSSLLVSEIEGAVHRGRRFAALHSHLGSPLYDIVGGTDTSSATIDLLRRYVLSLGGVPLVLRREHRGYVVNGLIGALTSTALQMHVRGEATAESLDRAWMLHRSAPIGPFGLLDLFGLDVVVDNLRNAVEDADRRTRRAEVLPLLHDMLERGRLGTKAGGGFYDYPDPVFQLPGFLDDRSGTVALHRHLVAAVIHRAALLAAAGVADPVDIDRAWVAAMGLDIGPLELLDRIGLVEFLVMSREHVDAGLVSGADAAEVEAFVRRRSRPASRIE